MPDPRRVLVALLGSAALAIALSPAPAAAGAAGEYTESIPDASGETPTNDLINGGSGSSGDGSTGEGAPLATDPVATGTPAGATASVMPPTKADEKLAEKGSAGQALLQLVGGTTRPADKLEETAGAGEQSVGSRLLNGSGDVGMGTTLYLMVGATALWAIAVSVGRRRQGPVFS